MMLSNFQKEVKKYLLNFLIKIFFAETKLQNVKLSFFLYTIYHQFSTFWVLEML